MGLTIGGLIKDVGQFALSTEGQVAGAIESVAKDVGRATSAAGQAVDSFESAVATTTTHLVQLTGLTDGGGHDKQYDGDFVDGQGNALPSGTPLDQIQPLTPKSGPARETVFYVNGVGATKEHELGSMEALANDPANPVNVIGIHDATEGTLVDLVNSAGDYFHPGSDPAAKTLQRAMYARLMEGGDVHVVAHSRGGLITSRALTDLKDQLMQGDAAHPPMSESQAEALMSRIKVETFGAAAPYYPDGPRYVHYVNNCDLVPMSAGLGGPLPSHPGRGAVVHYFEDHGNPSHNHDFNGMYMSHRVSFEDARAGRFKEPDAQHEPFGLPSLPFGL